MPGSTTSTRSSTPSWPRPGPATRAARTGRTTQIGFRRMNLDLRPRLPEIRCPALFVQGDRDAGIPLATTRATAAAVPGARLEVLPGRGHWSNRESPAEVNALIRDFFSE
ncbi:alpha/beta fold hydrolase [Pseudonocardia sp. HH130630-07]|uniref:alpha/beta fold hydrolase n=1 Tax=Pseudonocardia sp. HH130630-07 TaxID=1690815 RepID=UPI0030028293